MQDDNNNNGSLNTHDSGLADLGHSDFDWSQSAGDLSGVDLAGLFAEIIELQKKLMGKILKVVRG